jgi:hypothetical protein
VLVVVKKGERVEGRVDETEWTLFDDTKKGQWLAWKRKKQTGRLSLKFEKRVRHEAKGEQHVRRVRERTMSLLKGEATNQLEEASSRRGSKKVGM